MQLKVKFFFCLLFGTVSSVLFSQSSLGTIQGNTNEALPSSYNFQEYVYAEPDDQGDCQGIANSTAAIEEVFLAQTHRHAIDHPLFFTIGHRPALLQLAVTGTGPAPPTNCRWSDLISPASANKVDDSSRLMSSRTLPGQR